jgi:hypothetical protein
VTDLTRLALVPRNPGAKKDKVLRSRRLGRDIALRVRPQT